jgi:hypothetical protein
MGGIIYFQFFFRRLHHFCCSLYGGHIVAENFGLSATKVDSFYKFLPEMWLF